MKERSKKNQKNKKSEVIGTPATIEAVRRGDPSVLELLRTALLWARLHRNAGIRIVVDPDRIHQEAEEDD